MDKMTNYQELIKRILTKHVNNFASQPEEAVQSFLVTDDAHGHYIWLDLGWTPEERVNRPIAQVRLSNGKIWIEEDYTEHGIAEELLDAGVPHEDIVLAFHAPELRQYTDFAAA